jgi:hypothetical protein
VGVSAMRKVPTFMEVISCTENNPLENPGMSETTLLFIINALLSITRARMPFCSRREANSLIEVLL